jgi:hypothetical protein
MNYSGHRLPGSGPGKPSTIKQVNEQKDIYLRVTIYFSPSGM